MLSRLHLHGPVREALAEDYGRGDLTTEACVPAGALGRAVLAAREPLTFCGGPVVAEVYAQLDPEVRVEPRCAEGARLRPGDVAVEISGPARAILAGERVALNFCQRLSGVATLTRAYVERLHPGSPTRIADTRKTTPGLRLLERYAVRCGGGANHRADLGAAVLIKDNHVAAAGGVAEAIRRARAASPHTGRITCEVDTLGQLAEALAAGADAVLLDNFSDAEVAEAVAVVAGRALVEVSGGVPPQRVAALSAVGVDVISVGALTHSARAVDLGLDWVG
ncbi:MAG TPA: carboxylating nicotinate-nucleotide diphosphorylase [Pilimelia sp.]|nr:carboxylating nicotinate-nucleotide diphosphorylase [Pilimelia sp.]